MKEGGRTQPGMTGVHQNSSEGQGKIGRSTPEERAGQHNFVIGEPLPHEVLLGAWRPLQPIETEGVHTPYIREINGKPYIPVSLYGHQPISTNIPRQKIR
jgi:hypothetical protein